MSVVYVVMKGEAHEGGSVRGVFSTREKAVAWCREFVVEQPGRRPWTESSGEWHCGCDTISIEEWTIDYTY
jgi:hypothetical protein